MLLLTQAQGAAAEVVSTSVGERLTLSFRARLFQHVQRLSLTFHDTRGTADTIYRIQYDAPSRRYVIFGNGVSLLSACALLVSMAYVTAQIDLTLALVALGVAPPLFLLSRSYNRRMRRRYRGVKKMESSALNVVQGVLARYGWSRPSGATTASSIVSSTSHGLERVSVSASRQQKACSAYS